jgi:hypothetical protein
MGLEQMRTLDDGRCTAVHFQTLGQPSDLLQDTIVSKELTGDAFVLQLCDVECNAVFGWNAVNKGHETLLLSLTEE